MKRLAAAFFAVSFSFYTTPVQAAAGAWCDLGGVAPALDGAIGATEYSGSTVGVGNGFGGELGATVRVYMDSTPGGALSVATQSTGPALSCTWGMHDSAVLYIDSVPGAGFADTSMFTDIGPFGGDEGRAAASGMGTDGSRSLLTFAPGFAADYAIVIRGDSVSLFQLAVGAHTFVRSLTSSAGYATSCSKEFGGISMADLGSQAGNPIHWIGTLLNASNAFRSNELQGTTTAPAANPGAAPLALAAEDYDRFETAAPPVGLGSGFTWIDFDAYGGTGFEPGLPTTCGRLSSDNWASTGMSDASPAAFGTTHTTGDFARGPSSGGITTGGFYEFTTASNNRSFGWQPAATDFAPGTATLRLALGSAIGGFTISYSVRTFNNEDRSNSVTFSYSTDDASYTAAPALDYTSPAARDTPVAWVVTARSASFAVSAPTGGFLYLRFSSADVGGSGSRDELAIDDIVVTPMPITCGDGSISGTEVCDDGASNGTTPCGCQTTCTFGMSGTSCGPGSGALCDAPDVCDGAGACTDVLRASGFPCRAATGPCDAAEACTGATAACPPDASAPDGTPCADALACNGAEACASGACAAGTPTSCSDGDACTTDACNEPGGTCSHGAIASCCNVATDCGDGDVCTTDVCSGPGGTCSHGGISGCCNTDPDCADTSACTADSCDVSGHACVFAPIPGCCSSDTECSDGNACTTDACAAGTCVITPVGGCCLADGDCNDGNACTADACSGNVCGNTAIVDCCLADPDCDDGDTCTTDACVANRCDHAASCVDGGVDAGDVDMGDVDMGGTDAGDTDMAGIDMGDVDMGGTDAGDTDAGGTTDAGPRDGAMSGDAAGTDGGMVTMRGGCCHVGGTSDAGGALALLPLLGVLVALRRRRR